jgi:hypothetical protein
MLKTGILNPQINSLLTGTVQLPPARWDSAPYRKTGTTQLHRSGLEKAVG